MANTNTPAVNEQTSAEIEQWMTGDINAVASFEEAASTAEAVVLNPYEVLNKDKDVLVGVPFVILRGRIKHDDTYDSDFAIIHVIDNQNRMFVLTDGSTGIYKQYIELVNQHGRDGGFLIANGLSRSDYDYVNPETGKKSPATTYYLA